MICSSRRSFCVAAYLVYQVFQDWRLCYYAGGILGLLLLLKLKFQNQNVSGCT
jgi:hypothetical protein